jgi:hypothetical protein
MTVIAFVGPTQSVKEWMPKPVKIIIAMDLVWRMENVVVLNALVDALVLDPTNVLFANTCTTSKNAKKIVLEDFMST